jgi:biotin synthase
MMRKLLNEIKTIPAIELLVKYACVYRKKSPEICAIMNAKSGLCTEDCAFCAQSASRDCQIDVYGLKDRESIVRKAAYARGVLSADRFSIVTSGDSLEDHELDKVLGAVEDITKKVDIRICCSLGALDIEALKALQQAGVSRYHHNIETSERFYPRIVSTHFYSSRIDTIRSAARAGLEICSGGILGMGENWEDRLDMAHTLASLGVDAVPLNFLIPIAGTPLQGRPQISAEDALKSILLFRQILPESSSIKIIAGRETVLGDLQGLMFLAGADGIMSGGYLTVDGAVAEKNKELIRNVNSIWKNL